MKRLALAAIGFLVASVSTAPILVPADAGPPRTVVNRPIARTGTSARFRAARPRRQYDGAGCTVNDSDSTKIFIGIPSASNVAAADDSAAVGGSVNEVCSFYAGSLAGVSNHIDSGGYNSAIASGDSNELEGSDDFIGGGAQNTETQSFSGIASGEYNTAAGTLGFVGAGSKNAVRSDGSSIVGGGFALSQHCGDCSTDNNETFGNDAFIGGGDLNLASGNGSAIVGGGYSHAAACACATVNNQASGDDSFIGAGNSNFVSGLDAFLGAGTSNTITSAAAYSSLIGGGRNSVSAQYASIIGGYANSASGSYAIVAGGNSDVASGTLSFAAGYHAGATHPGSFVWSDYVSGSAVVKDKAANQFVARASGGSFFYSNEAATAGVKLSPGSGTWANLSDRTAKTAVAPLDEASVLAKVDALPVDEWQYTSERGVRHVGPMAQDFYAAFGVGEDDRHITSIDEDGVALAAIKALHRENTRLQRRLAMAESENAVRIKNLEARNAIMQTEIEALNRRR